MPDTIPRCSAIYLTGMYGAMGGRGLIFPLYPVYKTSIPLAFRSNVINLSNERKILNASLGLRQRFAQNDNRTSVVVILSGALAESCRRLAKQRIYNP